MSGKDGIPEAHLARGGVVESEVDDSTFLLFSALNVLGLEILFYTWTGGHAYGTRSG